MLELGIVDPGQTILDRRAHFTNLNDGLVGRACLVADLHGQLELLFQVRRRDSLQVGVQLDGEGVGLGIVTGRQAYPVVTQRRFGAAGGLGAPDDHAFEGRRAGIAQVPGKGVQPGAGGRRGRAAPPPPGQVGVGLILRLLTHEGVDHFVCGVEDFDRHRVDCFGQVVLHDGIVDPADRVRRLEKDRLLLR